MQTIEGKRVMIIMDNCITKVLLVSVFPQISADLKSFELLIGKDAVTLFKDYAKASNDYDLIIKTPIRGSKTPGKLQEYYNKVYAVSPFYGFLSFSKVTTRRHQMTKRLLIILHK